jgi:uncharacterized oxidoreductase
MKTRLPKPQDRLVLITGGSSGLGLALAQQMIQEGSQVIICGRDPLKLKAAQEGCPELVTYSCDITVPAQRAALAEWVKDHHPGVNVLINNAGIVRRYLFAQSQSLAEDLEAEFQTNLFAPLLLTQDLLPLLRRNLGAIVNVSSGLAYVPLHIQPSYCATKAALHSKTQSLRINLEPLGLSVVEVLYPAVRTPFQGGREPQGAMEPTEAAAQALKGLNRGKSVIHVGKVGLLYLLSRLMPQRALRLVSAMVPKDLSSLVSAKN